MAGESYTSPVTGETYTVPSYTDPADNPVAFKDFADTITGGGGIDIPATRVDAVVQTLDGSTWAEGMALSVVAAVPDDSSGQVGDVVFVAGKSPAPLGAANFTNTATGTYTDGGVDYKYLTLTGTSTVTIDVAGLADVLVIGAGASGGTYFGGGGGAGGYLAITDAYFAVGTSTVVVGAGGPAQTVNGAVGRPGSGSRVGNYYGLGGGGGGGATTTSGDSGGSGGGSEEAGTPGSGMSGQGNNGGQGNISAPFLAGGGGGAGAVGVAGASGGTGGAGSASSITGSSVTRGGGGGGAGNGVVGAGGAGGGGAGHATLGVSGTANTGGGGGGSSGASTTSGAGGSGVCILRVVV